MTITLAILIFTLTAAIHRQTIFNRGNSFGVGLLKGNNAAAEFFKANQIKGPIFNNYDIGGYLIYHLYPQEKVFVDNRPEAYPSEFFEDVYIPMQENEAVWQAQDDLHQFNAIFFSHRDATPWGQKFLVTLVDDPNWAPVFVDQFAIIFLKRNNHNEEISKKYESTD